MVQGDNLKRKSRPSVLQLQYMIELERLGNVHGFQTMIAQKCGVTQVAVNKYLKIAVEKGYLAEGYRFTEYGHKWLGGYKKLLGRLERYLKNIGVPKSDMKEAVRSMIENTERYVLEAILQNYEQQLPGLPDKKISPVSDIKNVVRQHTRHRVQYIFYRLDRNKNAPVSMSNKGFEETAYVVQEGENEYLELYIGEKTLDGPIRGEAVEVIPMSLKYENRGILEMAERQGGKLMIPLSACHIHKGQDGGLKGIMSVNIICSDDKAHILESTELLVFWL
ncbi:hypothetical protein [Clostridium sp. C105KSO13]|uniref:hypothetical protein n=1 Tax=Clostridium sp. C105KSO13 TaxID=1776045 RepID=UPI0007407CD9|nr:hypothetical protein [Clostridium sp. C105KSO13]CUX21646.1 hypothetical protein BN3456_00511 [Clostridium sp. C105KSO13]